MGNDKTIASVVKDALCTGCGTCVGICPKNAIRMVVDKTRGIYVPQLDNESCNQCGLCFQVCPGHSVDFQQLNLGIFGKEPEDAFLCNYLNFYIGHATNEDIRYNSASGGLVTALLIFALEEGLINGALVTRMRKGRPLEPEPFIARTKEEIISAAKSKYCPVPANTALKEILDKSKDGERFAVVGLSCHIHGIRKAEAVNKKLRDKIAWHLGLLCDHTPSFLATQYILHQAKVEREQISEIRYRGEGWPGKMKIELKGSEDILLPYIYWREGFGCFFHPWRCRLCSDRGNELADISFGDPWEIIRFDDENTGKSLAVSRSAVGEDLLERAVKKDIKLWRIEREKVRGAEIREGIGAKLAVSKALGKPVPFYNRSIPKPGLLEYIKAMSGYVQVFLGSKRFLWPLLPGLLSVARLLLLRKPLK
jgi:coenzyme F420 hydrogenase subunit beta